MTALLFAFFLIQASPAAKGFATGIVRASNGMPASGVRVYAIPAGDPNVASTGATVFESLAQTDASGRYRLEIPVGRYYIAVGSVNSPTYFPDTASIASAKAISIVAGSTIESVDFSRYTAAVPSPLGAIAVRPQASLPPGSTGVLSGVVRNADGSPAVGVTVYAVPLSFLNDNSVGGPPSVRILGTTITYTQLGPSVQQTVRGGGVAVTDSQGRYRLENVTPDIYDIVTGYSDFPSFYPGVDNIQNATAVTTTPTTMLTTLDFALSPPPKAFSIRGRVYAYSDRPAGGATLSLLNPSSFINANSVVTSRLSAFLPIRNYRPITTGGDGSFEIPGVVPGRYSIQARVPGASALTKTVDVVDAPATIDFSFSVTVLSGRITWEDGSPFSDPAIGPIAFSTTSNPNFVATTLLPVSNTGLFSSVIEPGDYRVYVRNLPVGYIVRSMTIGSVDLSKDDLHLTEDPPDTVQVRIAKGLYPGVRVQGEILDATSGSPPTAERVELCCFSRGPFERLSATVLPEGKFDFPQVPPGHYTVELQRSSTQPAAGIVNSTIDIGDQDKSGVLLVSATQQMTALTAAVTFEDGSNLPLTTPVTLTLLVKPGQARSAFLSNGAPAVEAASIEMKRLQDGTFWIPFPTGVLYTLSVGNTREGYRIKSISRFGANSSAPTVGADGGSTYTGVAPGTITIVLLRTPTN